MLEQNAIYDRIVEIKNDRFFSNREKLILFFDVVKDLFNYIVADGNVTYTEYAMFYYVLKRFEVPDDIRTNIISIRKYIAKLRKNNKLSPTNSFLEQALSYVVKLISLITAAEVPTELSKITTNLHIELPQDIEEQHKKIKQLTATIIQKILPQTPPNTSNNMIIICQNDENKYAVVIDEGLNYLCVMSKRLNSICFTNLEKTNSDIILTEDIAETTFYKTTNKTHIILEPNFLVDVTELTECFQLKNSNPIISIIRRLLPDNITSKSALEGNIINNMFDNLIEDVEIDFDTCLNNSLKRNVLSLYYIALEDKNTKYSLEKTKGNLEKITDDSIQQYIKSNRSNWFDKFNKLRDIVIENFLNTTNIIEPSFISNVFGLNGRLDLMTETDDKQNKTINILELKSGTGPQGICTANIGVNNKRNYAIPLWINHYIQIICYNMLLQHIVAENDFNKGSSTILYAGLNEKNPLRSVVEDNIHIQNEILFFRNYIVAFLREIADGNLNCIENINNELIEKTFPKYGIEKTKTFIDKFKSLSALEKSYLNTQLSFVTKEMFAQKIGLYIDNFNKNENGFASLWLNSIEEKQLASSVISNLSLDVHNSDFNKMYLRFDIINDDISVYQTPYRKGDICVMYPLNSNMLPIDNQLFRGKILEITDKYVVVNFRNKFSKELLKEDNYWGMESDYMEKNNNIILNSISNFMFSDSPNKDYILGIKEPTFK